MDGGGLSLGGNSGIIPFGTRSIIMYGLRQIFHNMISGLLVLQFVEVGMRSRIYSSYFFDSLRVSREFSNCNTNLVKEADNHQLTNSSNRHAIRVYQSSLSSSGLNVDLFVCKNYVLSSFLFLKFFYMFALDLSYNSL